MCGVLIWLLLPVTLVSALPCCPNDLDMIYINKSVYCEDETLITVYKWCDSFYALDLQDPDDGEDFLENEGKTEYSTNGNDWYNTYCTGMFRNASVEKNSALENMTGKVVGMICFDEADQVDEEHYVLYATCLLISCVFLLATLVIYILLPELRDLQGKCVLCFILSLMIGYLCLAYLQLPFTSPDVSTDKKCIVLAFLTYFWMLSAFFWLNMNCFNMWRSTVLAHINVTERKLMQFYFLGGWGIPLCFLVIALITHHVPGDHMIRPNFGITSCWFQGKLELWSYFYGPVLVLLIFNIVYFISMALYLWSDYRNPNPMPRIRSLRIKFYIYFKLFLVMGITWIFEILSSIDDKPWYVTDILNCFQGVIIFLVMIVLRKRVWRALAAKKPCGIKFNNCWERMADEETDNDDLVEDQQLSSNANMP